MWCYLLPVIIPLHLDSCVQQMNKQISLACQVMIPIQVQVCLNRVENAHVSSCIVGLLTATIRSGSIPEISACCHPVSELITAAFFSLLFYHKVYFDTHCMLAFRQAPRVEALSCKFPNLNSLILAQTVASLGLVYTFLQHSLELNNAQRSIEHLAPATIPQTTPPRSCHTQKTFFHTRSASPCLTKRESYESAMLTCGYRTPCVMRHRPPSTAQLSLAGCRVLVAVRVSQRHSKYVRNSAIS